VTTDGEIAAFVEVIARFGDDPAHHEDVAEALIHKGDRLRNLHRHGEAVDTYDDLLCRFADNDALRPYVVRALASKVATLRDHGRNEDLAVAEAEEASFAESSEPAITTAEIKLAARRRQGWATDMAESELVIASFADSTDPARIREVAAALVHRSDCLVYYDDAYDDAVDAYQEVVDRYGSSTDPAVLRLVAQALFMKHHVLSTWLGQVGFDVYDDLVDRFSDAADPTLRSYVAAALRGKGEAFSRLGDVQRAIAVCDDVVTRFGDDPTLGYQCAWALVSKATKLIRLTELEEAVALCDDVLARFGDVSESVAKDFLPSPQVPWYPPTLGYELLRESVAGALLTKAEAFSQLDRPNEAITFCDEVVARYGAEYRLKEIVAWALIHKGDTLGRSGRLKEAITAYDEVVALWKQGVGSGELTAMARSRKRVARFRRLIAALAFWKRANR
jgi:tetratricopeptide (TPR) repeat protein